VLVSFASVKIFINCDCEYNIQKICEDNSNSILCCYSERNVHITFVFHHPINYNILLYNLNNEHIQIYLVIFHEMACVDFYSGEIFVLMLKKKVHKSGKTSALHI
jgi:hypothetical protein